MSIDRTGTLQLGPDLALSYAEQGDPRGPVLVLLHGYSDSWPSYVPLMNELPGSFRTVALTLRGHGDSSKTLAGYGTKAFAGDVISGMEKLGISEAAIVGHSLGSLVAQRIALEAPRRVSSLVLIGAFATLKGNPAAEALWRDEVAGLRDPVDPGFVRAFQQSSLAAPVAADFFRRCRR
jgi:pimeloyl-ACP methyl ester carboxylesterase